MAASSMVTQAAGTSSCSESPRILAQQNPDEHPEWRRCRRGVTPYRVVRGYCMGMRIKTEKSDELKKLVDWIPSWITSDKSIQRVEFFAVGDPCPIRH